MADITVGMSAPEFSLAALDGKTQTLASLLHRGPVVLAFFKISCPVCQFTFPFLQRIADRFAGKSASIVGISQDDVPDTKDFNREYGIHFITLVDGPDYPASNAYALTNVPTIFLVTPDRKVAVECMGFDKAALEKIVAELAQHEKISATPLFHNDEIVPAFKPG